MSAPRAGGADAAAERLAALAEEVAACRLCPRLVDWREEVAREKRAAYADETYWGRGVPGFGDPDAWLMILGLAPGAHGSNRTGRQFTGDRSGIWLYRALHRAGLCDRPESRAREDGLALRGTYITAAVKCAPPANKPTGDEWTTCRPFLEREWEALASLRVVVALGGFAYARALQLLRAQGASVPRPAPKFAHGLELEIDGLTLLCSYHPSQQNTFTGRLTEPMFDAIWARAAELGASG